MPNLKVTKKEKWQVKLTKLISGFSFGLVSNSCQIIISKKQEKTHLNDGVIQIPFE